LIVIPDLMLLCEVKLRYEARVGNPEKSMLDSRFRGNDSIVFSPSDGWDLTFSRQKFAGKTIL